MYGFKVEAESSENTKRSNTYIDIYLSVQGWTLWYFHLRKYQRVCVCFYLFTAKNEWSHSLALCFRYLCAGNDEKAIKVDSRWDVMQTVISPQATQGFFFKLRRKIPDADKVWEEEKSEAQCEIILINVTDAAACVCVCVYCDTVHCITACNSGTVRGLWWVYWSTRGTLQFLTAPTILPAPELCGVQGKMGFLSSLTTSREKKKKPVPDTARTSVKVKDDGPR